MVVAVENSIHPHVYNSYYINITIIQPNYTCYADQYNRYLLNTVSYSQSYTLFHNSCNDAAVCAVTLYLVQLNVQLYLLGGTNVHPELTHGSYNQRDIEYKVPGQKAAVCSYVLTWYR